MNWNLTCYLISSLRLIWKLPKNFMSEILILTIFFKYMKKWQFFYVKCEVGAADAIKEM